MKHNYSVIFYGRNDCEYSEKMLQRLNETFSVVSCVLDEELESNIKARNLLNSKFDIILAFRSRFIIPKFAIDTAKVSINFHPAPPEHPGSACVNWALYNEDDLYGATAHLVAEKIDSGKIIDVSRFPILVEDTIVSLLDKTYQHSLEQFYRILEHIDSIIEGKFKCTEKWARSARLMKSLNEINFVDLSMAPEEVGRRIRATSHPLFPTKFNVLEKTYKITE